jgi:hypothetical protein
MHVGKDLVHRLFSLLQDLQATFEWLPSSSIAECEMIPLSLKRVKSVDSSPRRVICWEWSRSVGGDADADADVGGRRIRFPMQNAYQPNIRVFSALAESVQQQNLLPMTHGPKSAFKG